MPTKNSPRAQRDDVTLIATRDEDDLALISAPNVQAVVYTPEALPAWFGTLAVAVESGAFRVSRTVVHNADRCAIDDWLELHLPITHAPELRDSFRLDILRLVDRLQAITGASRFMLRILTESPTTECGFHVDTVPPGAPVCGLLRVYNGAATEYADPASVTSTRDFYQYLARRERLRRERNEARREGRTSELLDREIEALDADPPFMTAGTRPRVVPAGSIVAFKHVDIRDHWSDHPKSDAWIHCSPMAGGSRLVVNLAAPEPSLPRRRDTRAIVQ